jgi:hypothetical protein
VFRRSVVVLAVVVLVTLLVGLVAPPARAATDDLPVVRYRSPVEGPVVDHFDPPARRWQAGNRGIDYEVAAGTAVVAAADGEVAFAGAVGGALHVTVLHADGLRTSYSFLAETSVHAGQEVRAGQQVGVAGGPVHVGVRTPDGTYLDPEALFAGTLEPRVRLIPGAEDGLDPLAERRSLLDTLLDRGAAALAHFEATGGHWAELLAHYVDELNPIVHAQRAAEALQDWLDQLGRCTPASTPPPAPTRRRIVVLVSGLGTDSGGNSAWELDTATMGYAPGDVVRFSYQGGQAPPAGVAPPGTTTPTDRPGDASFVLATDPGLADIPVHEFTKTDSQQSVEESARRLEDLLAQVAEAEPGVPIDVIAHSQGGVVARLGVVEAGAAGSLPATVENLVTVGSPHQGAPLATALDAVQQTPTGRDVLGSIRGNWPFEDLDDRLPAMSDLSETSPVISRMHDIPIPEGVRFTSLGASGDLVVPGTATDDSQADTHRLIPTDPYLNAHGDLVKMPETTREIRLAVAGAGPTCQSFGEAVATFIEAEVIRSGETAVSADLATGAVDAEATRRALVPLAGLDD